MNRILVRMPKPVGDAIMATAMLRALRAHVPNAVIDLAGTAVVRPLIETLPYYNDYIEFKRGVKGGVRLAREVKARAYDCVLILPHSVGSTWPMTVARVPKRVGYEKYPGRRLLLTDHLPVPYDEMRRFVPTPMHEYYLGFVRSLGGPANADPWPEVRLRDEDAARALELREAHGLIDTPYIVCNPGAAFGTSKLWTPEGWACMADRLHAETGARMVFSGGPGEAEHARDIMQRMQAPVVDFATEPIGLGPLYGVVAGASLIVTLDSGPRHMAVAARKPIVCLMGPNDRRFTECCMDQTTVVQLDQLHCIACHYKNCPTEHECMRMLTPERVFEAAMNRWARSDLDATPVAG